MSSSLPKLPPESFTLGTPDPTNTLLKDFLEELVQKGKDNDDTTQIIFIKFIQCELFGTFKSQFQPSNAQSGHDQGLLRNGDKLYIDNNYKEIIKNAFSELHGHYKSGSEMHRWLSYKLKTNSSIGQLTGILSLRIRQQKIEQAYEIALKDIDNFSLETPPPDEVIKKLKNKYTEINYQCEEELTEVAFNAKKCSTTNLCKSFPKKN